MHYIEASRRQFVYYGHRPVALSGISPAIPKTDTVATKSAPERKSIAGSSIIDLDALVYRNCRCGI